MCRVRGTSPTVGSTPRRLTLRVRVIASQPCPRRVPDLPRSRRAAVDDAAIFPPGNAPLDRGRRRDHREHREEPYADLVGGVRGQRPRPRRPAPRSREPTGPLAVNVVVTGGAGALEPAVALGRRAPTAPLAGVEFALARRGDDLARNARRWSAWSTPLRRRRLDDVAGVRRAARCPRRRARPGSRRSTSSPARELRLKFRTGGADRRRVPASPSCRGASTRRWTGSCRSSARPGCTTRSATRDPETGFEHHGFLNVLLATRGRARRGRRRDAAAVLERRRRAAGRAVARDPRGLARAAALVHVVRLVQRAGRPRGPRRARPAGEDAAMSCWVEGAAGSPYDVDNLPYGVFSTARATDRGSACGSATTCSTLAPVAARPRCSTVAHDFEAPTLNAFMALGAAAWAAVRDRLDELLTDARSATASSRTWCRSTTSTLHLPFAVADYVDFYSSLHHATNVGRIFRPDGEPLLPNWRHLPVGYHGRAGTVVVSGTDVVRPARPAQAADADGTRRTARAGASTSRPSSASSSARRPRSGTRVPPTTFADARVRGRRCSTTGRPATSRPGSTCRSARSSASRSPPRSPPGSRRSRPSTAARVDLPGQDPAPLDYLRGRRHGAASTSPSRWCSTARWSAGRRTPPMYWSPAQMLAHLTVNGASLRTGDLFASGTDQRRRARPARLVPRAELGRRGAVPPAAASARSSRTATRSRSAPPPPAPLGGRIALGEVTGRVVPAAARVR